MMLAVIILFVLAATSLTVVRSELVVSTAADLLSALGNTSVHVVKLAANIQLEPGSQVPGASAGEPALLGRSVSITGLAGAAWSYPTLDVSLLQHAVLTIPVGVTLAVQHIVLRVGPTLSAHPAFIDVASKGVFSAQDTIRVVDVCPPLAATANEIIGQLQRPPSLPGAQAAFVWPSAFCAATETADSNASSASAAAEQCWALAMQLADVAYDGVFLSDYLYSAAADVSYVTRLTNSTVTCDQVMSPACVSSLGVYNCSKLVAEGQYMYGGTPPPGVQPPPSGDSRSNIIIGLAVGVPVALLLLLSVAAAVWILYRNAHHGSDTSGDSKASSFSASGGGGDDHISHDAGRDVEAGSDETLSEACIEMEVTRRFTDPRMSPSCYARSTNDTAFSGSDPDFTRKLTELGLSFEAATDLEIDSVIGHGAFGTIYRGSWQGVPVAAKALMFSSHEVDLVGGNSYGVLMEAVLSKSISHPNVVSTLSCNLQPAQSLDSSVNSPDNKTPPLVRDASQQDYRLLIIQEFCDGGTLRDAIEKRELAATWDSPALDLDMALGLAVGIASGMAYLHECNIVHGDLNPANVLLKHTDPASPDACGGSGSSRSNTGFVPKVCDFGFSVHLPANKSHVTVNQRGTPFYIAPEVLKFGSLSKAADVFAMGIILWELCMGESVWKADVSGKLMLHPTFPCLPDGCCPSSYRQLSRACIHLDLMQRPSMAIVLWSLLQMRDDALVQHSPPVCTRARARHSSPAGAAVVNSSANDASGDLSRTGLDHPSAQQATASNSAAAYAPSDCCPRPDVAAAIEDMKCVLTTTFAEGKSPCCKRDLEGGGSGST